MQKIQPPRNASLFRSQALDYAGNRRYGTVLLNRSLSFSILTALVGLLGSLMLAFFAFFGYAKKAQVSGILLPSQGLIRLMPARPGVITDRRVQDGQSVKAGDTLFLLASERSSARLGNTEQAISSQLNSRRDSFRSELVQLSQQANERMAASRRRANDLSAEIRRIDAQSALQDRRIALAEAGVERYVRLAADSFVSPVQLQDKQAELLDQQQRLADLARARAASARDLAAAHAELRDLQIQARRDQEGAVRSISVVEQDLSENEARREIQVQAPQSGTVTAITVAVGQSVSATQVLAVILPAGAPLEAELYVPSRSVGFIKTGVQVLLRYQAYSYQKFGQAKGTVRDISKTALRPEELMLAGAAVPNQANAEPLYRVRVALDKQTVKAFGQEQWLKSGAVVDASIVLEERKLYEWVLEPLYTITGRI